MTYFMYLLYRIIVSVLGRLPFKVLYIMSDGLTFLLFSVFRYRRGVVLSQIRKSFPDWEEKQVRKVAKESYRNLSDIIIESFKTDSMTKEEKLKRYHVVNPEVINVLAQEGKNVITVGGHFNNWEWGSVSVGYVFDHQIYGLYKPVANKKINAYINDMRMDVGTTMIPINQTRTLFESPLPRPSMIVFVADQSPSNVVDAIWLEFLGQDTACLHGPQKYAANTGWPVVYLHVYRISRGYYQIELTPLDISDPRTITSQFMHLLEKDIRKTPESWLWTHKRWKRRREEVQLQKQKRALKRSQN